MQCLQCVLVHATRYRKICPTAADIKQNYNIIRKLSIYKYIYVYAEKFVPCVGACAVSGWRQRATVDIRLPRAPSEGERACAEQSADRDMIPGHSA